MLLICHLQRLHTSGTQEVSPPSQKSVTCCCITFRASSLDAEMCLWLGIHESLLFGHTLVSCLWNIHLLWFQPGFLLMGLSSFHVPDSHHSGSVQAPSPSARGLLLRVSLSISMRRGAVQALLLWGGHTQSLRQCGPHLLPKQTVDQRSCFPALNNENKAA